MVTNNKRWEVVQYGVPPKDLFLGATTLSHQPGYTPVNLVISPFWGEVGRGDTNHGHYNFQSKRGGHTTHAYLFSYRTMPKSSPKGKGGLPQDPSTNSNHK